MRASSVSTAARLPHRAPRSSHPSDRRDLDVCASAAGHRVFTLPSPAGASIDHYRAEGLDLVPGAGGLAAAVPGSVDAWLLLLLEHGTWEVADALRPEGVRP